MGRVDDACAGERGRAFLHDLIAESVGHMIPRILQLPSKSDKEKRRPKPPFF
jgi:hypothetical protein